MSVDMNLYRLFYTVARSGNITKASEELFISQPAVSKSISRLESQLGVSLFYRNSRGVTLTKEGRLLYDYVEKAVGSINAGETIISKLKSLEEGSIAIGVSSTLCRHYLLPRLQKFKRLYPRFRIQLINKTTMETLSLLESGKVDLCVVSEPRQTDSIYFQKIMEIHDTFVASHEYLDSLALSPQDDLFTKAAFMFLEDNNISRRYIDCYFESNRMLITPDIEMGDMDILIDLAKIGMGVACIIKEFVKVELSQGILSEISVTPPIPKRNIGTAVLKNVRLSLAAQAFSDFIRTADPYDF